MLNTSVATTCDELVKWKNPEIFDGTLQKVASPYRKVWKSGTTNGSRPTDTGRYQLDRKSRLQTVTLYLRHCISSIVSPASADAHRLHSIYWISLNFFTQKALQRPQFTLPENSGDSLEFRRPHMTHMIWDYFKDLKRFFSKRVSVTMFSIFSAAIQLKSGIFKFKFNIWGLFWRISSINEVIGSIELPCDDACKDSLVKSLLVKSFY